MYECPINIIMSDIETQFEQEVLKAAQRCGISVDKDELVKALDYDRKQYEKGYADAKSEQRWIPCSERLPRMNQICLVTDETGSGTYEYRFCDQTYDEEQGWTYLKHRILAWMPMPEPYEGGDDIVR